VFIRNKRTEGGSCRVKRDERSNRDDVVGHRLGFLAQPTGAGCALIVLDFEL
jgi:hypothetical protein